ncbi:hypothetical protein QUF80_10900 [Desulfococcaceae bacterium HSG8]|nr:hypothetical protein [Desulfococcaceae bacterium HSG8]
MRKPWMVIKGKMTPEEFLSGSPKDMLLQHKLNMAAMEIKHTYELLYTERRQYESRIRSLETEVTEMRTFVGQAIQSSPVNISPTINVSPSISQSEENRRIQGETIQGCVQAEEIGNHSQQFAGETGGDVRRKR